MNLAMAMFHTLKIETMMKASPLSVVPLISVSILLFLFENIGLTEEHLFSNTKMASAFNIPESV
jgi:hypothetical protein